MRAKSYPALLAPLFLVALFLLNQRYSAKLAPFALPTCTDAATISQTDTETINTVLRHLTSKSTFFSLFSVALDKDCPFWRDDDAQCRIQACSVDTCPDSEVPPVWRANCENASQQPKRKDILNDVDRSLNGLAALIGTPPCLAADPAAWITPDDDDESNYVDLRRNPERYTGYDGPGAAKVWQAIYDENCFTFSAKCSSGICAPDTCKEERVLYRLISGLHASISMHIAKDYLFGTRWDVNLDIYKRRIHAFPERIANLRVAYAVVLRAVGKAASVLHPSAYDYDTDNAANDVLTRAKLRKLFDLPILNPTCEHKVFDESDMFLRDNQHQLPEFRNAFRNISMIMDCVGCEKCRLWGKLQFLGLGTAMRILFEHEMPHFQRNDVIALINLLHKLSTSVLWLEQMDQLIQRNVRIRLKVGAFLGVIFIILISLTVHNRNPPASQNQTSKPPNNKQQELEANSKLDSNEPELIRRRKRAPARAD